MSLRPIIKWLDHPFGEQPVQAWSQFSPFHVFQVRQLAWEQRSFLWGMSMNYCIEYWGNTYTTYLLTITRLQKRALRILTFSKRTDSSRLLFQYIRVLPFDLIYTLKTAQLTHRIVMNDAPLPITLFTLPARSTRAAVNMCFSLPCVRNTYGKRLNLRERLSGIMCRLI